MYMWVPLNSKRLNPNSCLIQSPLQTHLSVIYASCTLDTLLSGVLGPHYSCVVIPWQFFRRKLFRGSSSFAEKCISKVCPCLKHLPTVLCPAIMLSWMKCALLKKIWLWSGPCQKTEYAWWCYSLSQSEIKAQFLFAAKIDWNRQNASKTPKTHVNTMQKDLLNSKLDKSQRKCRFELNVNGNDCTHDSEIFYHTYIQGPLSAHPGDGTALSATLDARDKPIMGCWPPHFRSPRAHSWNRQTIGLTRPSSHWGPIFVISSVLLAVVPLLSFAGFCPVQII